MKDEIKEILSLLKSSSWCNEANQIEDYITNLQEQLHQASLDIQELTEKDNGCPSWCDKLTNLQEKLDFMIDRNDEKQERIDKAIEYVKRVCESEKNINPYILHAPTLLNILKGSE